jgi:hypothetical protein
MSHRTCEHLRYCVLSQLVRTREILANLQMLAEGTITYIDITKIIGHYSTRHSICEQKAHDKNAPKHTTVCLEIGENFVLDKFVYADP